MALTIAELEAHTAEFLPAREVMGGKRGKTDDCGCDGDNFWFDASDDDSQANYNSGISVLQVNALNDTDILSVNN